MPGVPSAAVREASESQIMIFTPGVEDLPLQAFLPISVKLCRKGLLEMSKEIGIWLLGSMQGIPTPLWMLPADRISSSVPVVVVGTSLLFGFLGMLWRAFAPELSRASPERANTCLLFVIFAHVLAHEFYFQSAN